MLDKKTNVVQVAIEEPDASAVSIKPNANTVKNKKWTVFTELIKKLFHSHKFHKAIVILVIIDCLCVAVELIIEHIDVYVLGYDGDMKKSDDLPATYSANKSVSNGVTDYNNATSTSYSKPTDPNYNLHLFLAVLAKILKITSIIILSVFVVEILFKLVFLFKMFIRSKFEIFDAFIIVVSLGVNIFLLMNKKMVMSIGGLLTLFRLWRITEIVNGKGRVSSFIFFVA